MVCYFVFHFTTFTAPSFPLHLLLLCYLYSFWNQQFNGKYLNKIYKVFDLVRNFFPSPMLVKTLQTPDDLCGPPGSRALVVALFVCRQMNFSFEALPALHAVRWLPSFVCFIVLFFLELALSFFLSFCRCFFLFFFFFFLFGGTFGWEGKSLSYTRAFIFPIAFGVFPNFASWKSVRCSVHSKSIITVIFGQNYRLSLSP